MTFIQTKSSQMQSSSVSKLGEDTRKERRDAAQKYQQYVGFILDEQEYAIPIEKIQEIVLYNGVTRLP